MYFVEMDALFPSPVFCIEDYISIEMHATAAGALSNVKYFAYSIFLKSGQTCRDANSSTLL